MKRENKLVRPSNRNLCAASFASLLLACTGLSSQPGGGLDTGHGATPAGTAGATGAPGPAGSNAGSGPGTGGQAATCTATAPLPLSKPRIWRLTGSQLANTLRDEFAFTPTSLNDLPSDERLDGFANQAAKLTIAPLLADTYFTMGDELGAQAVANPAAFGIACSVASLAPGACLNDFITSAGAKMWRRPLTQSEVSAYSTLFATTAAQGEGAAAA